jgi:hypothetical protein
MSNLADFMKEPVTLHLLDKLRVARERDAACPSGHPDARRLELELYAAARAVDERLRGRANYEAAR